MLTATVEETTRLSLTNPDGSPAEYLLEPGEPVEDVTPEHVNVIVQMGVAEWDGDPADVTRVPPGAYDPSDATVAEVNAYLDEHPEDREAVLQAERDGKGRSGILEGPHANPPEDLGGADGNPTTEV